MKILILSYNDGVYISGTYTTVVDLFFNLREFIDIKFKTIIDLDPISIMRYYKLHKFFGDGRILSSLTRDRDFESDIIIMSCELLAILAHGNAGVRQIPLRVNIGCDKLILLDSFDLQRFKYAEFSPNVGHHISFNECILLSNPANYDILPVETSEYYHKFSEMRLGVVGDLYQDRIYERKRKKHAMIKPGIYIENIGKSIFESIYHGYIINYIASEERVEDGLCHYLRLFGVDPHKDHYPLPISKEDIEEQLFFDQNDLILESI